MENKKRILQTTLALILSSSAYSSYALDIPANNNILRFDAGVNETSYYRSGLVKMGSYFGMDLNGDGVISAYERTAIAPGPLGGITLGALQPALGSHSSCPNGSESPGPDMPWCFFGNTGMHQVTGTPVVSNGNGTLDFTGWGVTWNGIANIPLGGAPADFPADTGLGNISCANTPCQIGDISNLDYYAHIPLGDPSGFGGVYYTLHLANIDMGPVATITLNVTNGATQECNSSIGNNVSIQANYTVPEGDSLDTINWSVDGAVVASGMNLDYVFGLGKHLVEVEITSFNGVVGKASTNVLIQDTTPPETIAAFVDKHHNTPVTTIRHKSKVKVKAEALDVCDPAPVTTAMIGVPIENNSKIRANKHKGSVKLDATSLTLSVTGADSSGNSSSAEAVLTITD